MCRGMKLNICMWKTNNTFFFYSTIILHCSPVRPGQRVIKPTKFLSPNIQDNSDMDNFISSLVVIKRWTKSFGATAKKHPLHSVCNSHIPHPLVDKCTQHKTAHTINKYRRNNNVTLHYGPTLHSLSITVKLCGAVNTHSGSLNSILKLLSVIVSLIKRPIFIHVDREFEMNINDSETKTSDTNNSWGTHYKICGLNVQSFDPKKGVRLSTIITFCRVHSNTPTLFYDTRYDVYTCRVLS